jgi:hypothetical protein
MQMKAANVQLAHIVGVNMDTPPCEVRNFVTLLEVYGTLIEQSILKPEVETLQDQRQRSVN